MRLVLGAVVQLVFLALVFGALEWCFPNHPEQPRLRREWRTDLAFFFGQHLVWIGLEVGAVLWLREPLGALLPAGVRAAIHAQPWPLMAFEVVVAGDLVTYAYHRASHANRFLWTFHRVHHSSPQLDWLAAHREHPVDGLLTQLAMNLPALLLGVGLGGLAALVAFRGLWAAFIHSNVRLPVGPLRVLLGAPELHHWHHASSERMRHNYANLAPWIDVLFGTYHCPPDQKASVGLAGQAPRTYLGWIFGVGSRDLHRSADTERLTRSEHGHDLVPFARHDDRVLPLGREASVGGDDGPAVIEQAHGGAAQVDHRLDGDRHAGLEARTHAAPAGVGDVRIGVHVAPDAVPTDLGHDARAFMSGQLLDRGADVAEARALPDDGHAGIAAPARDLDDVPRVGARLADDEHRAGVAVVAVELGRDVDVDDVARLQDLSLVRDAVADDVVAARADRGGKPLVAELAGPTAVPRGVLADEAIDLGGRHARTQPGADERQGLRRHPSGAPHALDLGGAQDLDRHRP
jgi:sterol desaturase/sphingolipid hydroxylase (fatty acid hydroxylase superfamily)